MAHLAPDVVTHAYRGRLTVLPHLSGANGRLTIQENEVERPAPRRASRRFRRIASRLDRRRSTGAACSGSARGSARRSAPCSSSAAATRRRRQPAPRTARRRPRRTTTTPPSATTGTCSKINQETAGPYPGDGSNGPTVLTSSRRGPKRHPLELCRHERHRRRRSAQHRPHDRVGVDVRAAGGRVRSTCGTAIAKGATRSTRRA